MAYSVCDLLELWLKVEVYGVNSKYSKYSE